MGEAWKTVGISGPELRLEGKTIRQPGRTVRQRSSASGQGSAASEKRSFVSRHRSPDAEESSSGLARPSRPFENPGVGSNQVIVIMKN